MSKALLGAALAVAPCFAQWLNHPSVGIPRTVDEPDLTAAAAKVADGKPDLSDIWTSGTAKYLDPNFGHMRL
jgi:hypothetical protein